MSEETNTSNFFSMTGFGSGAAATAGYTVTVETRSVNSRHLDLNMRSNMPFPAVEARINKLAAGLLSRGRVDISVQVTGNEASQGTVIVNEEKFRAYISAYQQGARFAGLAVDELPLKDVVTEVLARRDVLEYSAREVPGEELQDAVFEATEQALIALRKMRSHEGRSLKSALSGYLDEVAFYQGKLLSLAESSVAAVEQRLKTRLESLKDIQIDPQRYAQEVVFYAERLDISEEVVRLASHIGQLRECFQNGGGRKMEFILQEMGREVNTIGSKSQSTDISQIVVECKAILEKLREQVLNVE